MTFHRDNVRVRIEAQYLELSGLLAGGRLRRAVNQAQTPTKSGTYLQGHQPLLPIAFTIMIYPFTDCWLPAVKGIPAVWCMCHASISWVGWTMGSGGRRLGPMDWS